MINTRRLRCTIGWLGMLLPWIVLILAQINGYGWPDSISATYYFAPCVTPFMIILGSAGLLLFSYKGYDKLDDIICSLAGLFGLGICLLPCGIGKLVDKGVMADLAKVGTFQLSPEISGWLHSACALFFFGLLAFNSLFLFTKTSGEMTPNKKKRNLIYKICGVGMIASFILLAFLSGTWAGIWLVETIALAFFGISWLTKADCYPWLFCDKK